MQLRFLSGVSNAALVVGCGMLGLAVATAPLMSEQYPIENTLRSAVKRPMMLIGADGKLFAQRGDCVAEPVTLAELPPHLIDALLAMEDRRFYDHMGIDPRGILRAAKRNYDAGSHREGGSTITQQLVKMSFLTRAKTLERKVDEALLATWLELRLSKDQILERYLNSAYFGEGCFGVRAAARHLFDKPVGALNVSEAALMVALLRSPTQLTQNFGDARQRAALVMQAMVRDGRLDAARLTDSPPAQLHTAREEETGSDYADWLTESMQKDIGDTRSRRPIQVYTTFDPGLQRAAQDAVRAVLNKQGPRLKASQAGLVAMRTDGRVLAMVGGKDRTASQFNRVVQARRQPGSAFKMFVYLAALKAGAQLDMSLADEPISIEGWEPENFGGGYRGGVTLTQAFASSINTVAVKLSEAVGRDAVIKTARDLGITSPMAPNASLPLGTSEVSLLELTSAYASIAAGVYPVKPWGVAGLDAKPADGGQPPQESGLWKLRQAEDMRELLASVVRKGSGGLAQLSIPTFGKTGTSQEHRDAWFVGFAGNLVVGVWVGNDDSSPMRGVTGGSLPAQIWRTFMRDAMKTDAGFVRKLSRVAVFEARSKAPLDRPTSGLASLEEGILAAEPKSRKTVRLRYADDPLAPFFGGSERFPPYQQRAEQRYGQQRPQTRQRSSAEFDRKLGDMGWPGQ